MKPTINEMKMREKEQNYGRNYLALPNETWRIVLC